MKENPFVSVRESFYTNIPFVTSRIRGVTLPRVTEVIEFFVLVVGSLNSLR